MCGGVVGAVDGRMDMWIISTAFLDQCNVFVFFSRDDDHFRVWLSDRPDGATLKVAVCFRFYQCLILAVIPTVEELRWNFES